MKKEFSSGGVVLSNDDILLLKKYNSDWVLPKGRIEQGESKRQTAIREVHEETGIRTKIIRYIGEIHYKFYNPSEEEDIHKTVYWFLMEAENTNPTPQIEEGFVKAMFLPAELALASIRYDDEKTIIEQVIKRENIVADKNKKNI